MSPSNLEARESPCQFVLCDDGRDISPFPKLDYPRVVKIYGMC